MDLHTAARTAGILAALAGGTAATSSADDAIAPFVVVHVVNEAGVSQDLIKTAQANVAGIYDAIGVAVAWSDHGVDGPAVLIVKIVRDANAERLGVGTATSLGAALRGESGRGRFAYVFYERIEQVSRKCRLDVSAVLGAAMAHELGHLLLPHGSHTPWGLMSAEWGSSDLLTADRRCLHFTAWQGKLIRAGLETRTR